MALRYMRDKLVARLNSCGYKGEVDFLYLPIDFRSAKQKRSLGCIRCMRRNRCNVGYCFLNFRTSAALVRFREEFHGQQSGDKLPGFNSKKVLEVSPARVQGLHPNIVRLQGSPIMAKASLEREWCPGSEGPWMCLITGVKMVSLSAVCKSLAMFLVLCHPIRII